MIQLLVPIDDIDYLAQLFNAYQYGLLSLERAIAPRESMAEYAALAAQDEANDTQYIAELAQHQQHLQLLTHALNSLYTCIAFACLELDAFLSAGSDFTVYAAHSRVDYVSEFGSPDGKDFQRTGTKRTGIKRAILRKEADALAPFQLPVVLAQYFPGSPTAGEKIGSSAPQDFAYFSNLVANEVIFALHNPVESATADNLSTYQQQEAHALGFDEAVLADERFSEVENDLRGIALVQQFEAVLRQAQAAATLYATLSPEDPAGYQQLFDLLDQLRNGPLIS